MNNQEARDFIPNSWIINLENDCLDDVWTLTIGFTKLP